MVQQVGVVDVLVRGNTNPLERDLQRARSHSAQFEQDFKKTASNVVASTNDMNRSFGVATLLLRRLQVLIAGVVSGIGIRQLQIMADTWSDLRSRLANVVGGFEQADTVMTRLESVARRTYSSFQTTAESFIFNSRALKDLGYSTKTQLDFTEALNNALVVSGAKGERAAQIQFNLSKAIGQGTLRGDELNSILQVGGRVASVLAEHLGTTTTKLKEMGQQGLIKTADIVAALTGKLEILREEADAMPATIGDAFVLIGNATLGFVGRVDQALGASERLAVFLKENVADAIVAATDEAINLATAFASWVGSFVQTETSVRGLVQTTYLLGVNMETVRKIGTFLFVGLLTRVAIPAVSLLARLMLGPLIAAFNGVLAAMTLMAAHPVMGTLTLFARLIPVAVAALYTFRDEIKNVFGIELASVVKDGANFIIRSMVFAVNTVKALWADFPAFLDVIMVKAANSIIDRFNDTFSVKIGGKGLLGLLGLEEKTLIDVEGLIPKLTVDPANQAAFNKSIDDLLKKTREGLGVDYVGDLMETTAATASATQATEGMIDSIDNLVTQVDAKAAKAYSKMTQSARDFIATQNLQRASLGLTAEETNRLRYQQDLLNQARDNDIKLTPIQKRELMGLGFEMAAAEERTRKMAEAFDFARDLVGDFVQDLRSGLREGQSFFEAFGNAVNNVLDKIIDKLLNQFIDALFQSKSAMSGFGGGGGIFSALFGGGGGAGGFYPGVSVVSPSVGVYHGGGIAGVTSQARRRVDPRAFIGAPSYHVGGMAGFRPGEIPAILTKGEPVFKSMDHARSALGGEASNITFAPSTSISIHGASPQEVMAQVKKELDDRDRRHNQALPGMIARGRSDRTIRGRN